VGGSWLHWAREQKGPLGGPHPPSQAAVEEGFHQSGEEEGEGRQRTLLRN